MELFIIEDLVQYYFDWKKGSQSQVLTPAKASINVQECISLPYQAHFASLKTCLLPQWVNYKCFSSFLPFLKLSALQYYTLENAVYNFEKSGEKSKNMRVNLDLTVSCPKDGHLYFCLAFRSHCAVFSNLFVYIVPLACTDVPWNNFLKITYLKSLILHNLALYYASQNRIACCPVCLWRKSTILAWRLYGFWFGYGT